MPILTTDRDFVRFAANTADRAPWIGRTSRTRALEVPAVPIEIYPKGTRNLEKRSLQ